MEEILKAALERKGITQKELADMIHVTPQAVSKWMNGESRPTVDNVIEIDKALGINLIQVFTKNIHRGKKEMKQMALNELNNYEMAKNEAVSILSRTQIKDNYSHSVYYLCEHLITAVIGLTYHQMINNDNEKDEICYQDIFVNIEDFFNEELPNKVAGLYENYLEYSFYLMGGDLFESFGESQMINHDYCEDAMNEWYIFCKALTKHPASPIYNELLVALSEIVNLQ